MSDIDLSYFKLLKREIQTEYLKNNSPSQDEISKWKGIDIVYFQEELRKKAKGNISEKTFYTYFKSNNTEKLPRIDMLNLLSIYVGYESWYDFKKQNPISNNQSEQDKSDKGKIEVSLGNEQEENIILQNNTIDNKELNLNKKKHFIQSKTYLWISLFSVIIIATSIILSEYVFKKTYSFCFTDADRGTTIQNTIDIKVIKENESPIHYKVKAGECFNISTKDKVLKMEISTPLYEKVEIYRNLENAPETEYISLKPDDYALMLYYYSTKDTNNTSLEHIKNKQQKLNSLISDNALIYQVFDNEIYGIETLSKQKYIGLVTTPTQSLRNLKVLATKIENGKITSIKFKIETNEK